VVSLGIPFGAIFLLFKFDWDRSECLFLGRPGLVAGGESLSSAAVGLSRQTDARRQSSGEGGVC